VFAVLPTAVAVPQAIADSAVVGKLYQVALAWRRVGTDPPESVAERDQLTHRDDQADFRIAFDRMRQAKESGAALVDARRVPAEQAVVVAVMTLAGMNPKRRMAPAASWIGAMLQNRIHVRIL
jgi:hypothetical protein